MDTHSFPFIQKTVSGINMRLAYLDVMYYDYLLSGEKDVATFNTTVADIQSLVTSLKTSFRNLLNTEVIIEQDYLNRLSYLGLQCKQQNLIRDTSDWEKVLHLTDPRRGFKPVFQYLIEALDEVNHILRVLSNNYIEFDPKGGSVDKLDQKLLCLNTKFEIVSSYVKILYLISHFVTNKTESISKVKLTSVK